MPIHGMNPLHAYLIANNAYKLMEQLVFLVILFTAKMVYSVIYSTYVIFMK